MSKRVTGTVIRNAAKSRMPWYRLTTEPSSCKPSEQQHDWNCDKETEHKSDHGHRCPPSLRKRLRLCANVTNGPAVKANKNQWCENERQDKRAANK